MTGGFSYGADRNIICTSIMAAFTFISDACVSEVYRWFERCSGTVTNNTVLVCRQMSKGLSGTDVSVMAGGAIVHDAHVTECCISKVAGVMTVGAVLVIWTGWYVIT